MSTNRIPRCGSTFAVLLVSLVAGLGAQDMVPDFKKLAPVAPCAALVEAARSNHISIEGIDPPGNEGSLLPGDCVASLITLCERRGRQTQWLLYIEAAAPDPKAKPPEPAPALVVYSCIGDKIEIERRKSPVNLRLLGPYGAGIKPSKAEIKTASVYVEKNFLALGMDQAAAMIHRMCQSNWHGSVHFSHKPLSEREIDEGRRLAARLQLTPAELRGLFGAGLALSSYAGLVQETPGLDHLFFKVVTLPSVWSLVQHVGVKTSVDFVNERIEPAAVTSWGLPDLPAYHVPVALRFNGQPGLLVTLVVAPARPPFLGCGGIVGFVAEKPGDKETYLSWRVLSAHCRR